MAGDNNCICVQEQIFGRLVRWLFAISNMPVVVLLLVCSFQEKRQNHLMPIFFIIMAVVAAIPMILFWTAKLQTIVRSDGLYVRFFPFHIKFKRFVFEDIGQYFAREYKPLMEYGGWGIKFGFKGKAYTVSGNKGLQIVFKNGKKLLIGSQNPETLVDAIDSIVKK